MPQTKEDATQRGLSQITPVPSPDTIQVASNFIPVQNAQIFELVVLKAQADLQIT